MRSSAEPGGREVSPRVRGMGPFGSVVLVTTLALLATACTAADGAGTKAAGEEAPVTLRIGTDDGPGRRSSAQIEEFARQVDALTAGRVRVEPVWQAAGDTGADDWDQKVARLVVDGDLDMGLVPARAWDTEGVTTMRALNAPFLVSSDELTAEIVRSDVADTMLAGLDETGVRGLALIPEGMRIVVSFGDPLLDPGDFPGALIRVPASATTYATFEALGATPDDASADDPAIAAGEVEGAETAFALAGGFAPTLRSATGNVFLWPKVNSLVVNAERYAGLTEETRAALEQAAAATRDWAIETQPSTAQDAVAFCEAGGTIVLASPDEATALEQATAPVADSLRSDKATAAIIDAIEQIADAGDFPAAQVQACDGRATGPAGPSEPLTAPGEPGGLPEGVYRFEHTEDYLRAAGLPEADVFENAGVFTVTLRGGRWSYEQQPLNAAVITTECEGFYAVAGPVFTGSATTRPNRGQCAPDLWTATWSFQDDVLRWSDVSIADFAAVFAGEDGWRKIG